MLNQITRCKPLLGTFVEVSVSGDTPDKQLIRYTQQAFECIAQVQQQMSYFESDSLLNKVNQYASKGVVPITDELHQVLSFALQLSEATAGAFDVSVAGQLVSSGRLPNYGFAYNVQSSWQDIKLTEHGVYFERPLILELGGIAKGFAVDCALACLRDCDCEITINAGGDIRMSHWQDQTLAIKVPYSACSSSGSNSHSPSQNDCVDVPMQAAAVATSAHYYLAGKPMITDPLARQVANNKVSVSVFSESCMTADALTKVAFLYPDYKTIFSRYQAQLVCVDSNAKILNSVP